MRILLNVLLCLVTVVLVASALGRMPRARDVRNDTEYAEFVEHKDEFDLLFFGSSRFYRGIIPERFDAEMKRRGTPVNSFNLGMRGMRSHEVNERLRRALATEPSRLKWIVVELEEWRPQTENFWTDRSIAWHDWPETVSVIRSAWIQEKPFWTRVENVRINLLQFVARTAVVGVAAENTRTWFNSLTKPPDPEAVQLSRLARQWRGFAPFSQVEYQTGLTGLHRQEFLNLRQTFERNVQRLPAINAADAPFDSYNLEALQDQIEFAREAGVGLIYLILPSYEPVPRFHRLNDAGLVPNLLAFDDPVAHPTLYQVGSRFDRRHLNQKGAMEFTSLLAERVSALIADE